MLRPVMLISLWTIGLTPLVISLLMVVSMLGRPAPCDRPECMGKTYGWELLILPAATGVPFFVGRLISKVGRKKTIWLPSTGENHDQ